MTGLGLTPPQSWHLLCLFKSTLLLINVETWRAVSGARPRGGGGRLSPRLLSHVLATPLQFEGGLGCYGHYLLSKSHLPWLGRVDTNLLIIIYFFGKAADNDFQKDFVLLLCTYWIFVMQ
jgi:hypothetical protein